MQVFRPTSGSLDDTRAEIAPRGVLAGVRGYVFWTFVIVVTALCVLPFDFWWSKKLVSHLLPSEINRILKLSEIFGHGFGVVIVAVGILCLSPGLKRYVPRLAACAVLSGITANMVKVAFGRQRPGQFGLKFPEKISDTFLGVYPGEAGHLNLDHVTQSLPSAHAATAVGLAIGLAWLFPKGRFLFMALAVATCIQRVSFQAHWMSDVLIGAAIGVVVAGSLTQNWGLGWAFGKLEKPALDHLLAGRLTGVDQAPKSTGDDNVSSGNDLSDRHAA